ncbi:ABC transporter ATP-binding protein [Desulfocurvus sp. DL9XJH121]
MLEARELAKAFAGRDVVGGVSFTLAQGETLAVVGPSGCGKTTLLYMLCGLTAPSSGQVLLGGGPVSGPSRDIAIILQDYGLLPWKTVLDNVGLGLRIQGAPRAEREAAARAMLAEMGLAGRENDYPARLSGGEQQRVAIARALAVRPRLLLMDEPFSSLDFITREKLQQALLATWQRRGAPYVLVTHSVEEAVFLGRRILVMGGDPAHVTARVDNPAFASPGHRDAPAFHETARAVRAALAEAS